MNTNRLSQIACDIRANGTIGNILAMCIFFGEDTFAPSKRTQRALIAFENDTDENLFSGTTNTLQQ